MAEYRLEARDGSGTYPIPQGETVIGRGPFLGVADKRVSRNHAILEVVDDKLRIKPIHTNPCFYQASHKGTFLALERDKWCWLHSGDCISLLPDTYSFQVIAQHPSQEATLRNSQEFDEDFALKNNSQGSTSDCGTKTEVEEPTHTSNSKPGASPSSAICDERNKERCNDLSGAVSCKLDEDLTRPAPRKRVLPQWMLQGDLMIQSLPSPVVKAGKKRRNVLADRTRKAVESVTEKQPSHLKKSRNNGEGGVKKKSMAAVQAEESPGTSSDTIPTRIKHEHSPESITHNKEQEIEMESWDDPPSPSLKIESSGSPSGCSSANRDQASGSQKVNNVINQSTRSPETSQQAQKSRMPCIYAERCYRKNPVHFQEFSHPGDSDYHDVESGSQDDNDDRPECPYGTDCYRKNPQHKLEYKHTKPPGRRLRKRTTKKAKSAVDGDSDNDGEPNEYDLEDSFIDDDDEEEEDITDEDSDWMPDSEEKDSEDVKQLVKEAKRFVKGKH
ncbi:aprataxin and PNK-like factor [Pyxicephalus adspersus]|uniref:Aprataxin and PNK-like factor n=1 Tax=Pyxicephalus adspersus TaxID=30357 RepID=A0AAV3AP98_PYXAD|nr:TPA: hypothetical protein GDO54_011257 [Pyxicephalus adspersus]